MVSTLVVQDKSLAQPVPDLVIANTTVISGSSPPRHGVDVLVSDDRIEAIVPHGRAPSAARTIDGKGRYTIPGLIDSHVHLGHTAIFDESTAEQRPDLVVSYRQQLGRSFLHYGFTSLIDLDLRPQTAEWYEQLEEAPSLYHCGRGVRVAGGYGPSFVPVEMMVRAFPNLVHEPSFADAWPQLLDPANYTPAAAADRVVDAGGICMKAYADVGFGGMFDWPTPAAATLAALATEARSRDLAFLVHANDAGAWSTAIAGAADVLAHGLWHWPGDRRSTQLDIAAMNAIDAAVAAGVALQPTMRVVIGERSTLTWDLLQDERMADALPADILGYLATERGHWSQRELEEIYARLNPYPDAGPLDLIDTSIKRVIATTGQFHRAGGKLIFGSDTPAQNGIGNPPGLNGLLELQAWFEAGIPLDEIFQALTSRNAEVFGLENEIGTIDPGMRADLLILDENPLVSIDAYDTVETVISSGAVYKRRELSAATR